LRQIFTFAHSALLNAKFVFSTSKKSYFVALFFLNISLKRLQWPVELFKLVSCLVTCASAKRAPFSDSLQLISLFVIAYRNPTVASVLAVTLIVYGDYEPAAQVQSLACGARAVEFGSKPNQAHLRCRLHVVQTSVRLSDWFRWVRFYNGRLELDRTEPNQPEGRTEELNQTVLHRRPIITPPR